MFIFDVIINILDYLFDVISPVAFLMLLTGIIAYILGRVSVQITQEKENHGPPAA